MFEFPHWQFRSTQYDRNSGLEREAFGKEATLCLPPTQPTLGPTSSPVSRQCQHHHCPQGSKPHVLPVGHAVSCEGSCGTSSIQ